jgi:hypothetical protein
MKFYVRKNIRLDPRFVQVKCEQCIGPREIVKFKEMNEDEITELFSKFVPVFSGTTKHIVDVESCVCIRKNSLLDFIDDLVKGYT